MAAHNHNKNYVVIIKIVPHTHTNKTTKKLVKQQIFNDCYDVKQNKSATRQNRGAKFHKSTPKQTTQKKNKAEQK